MGGASGEQLEKIASNIQLVDSDDVILFEENVTTDEVEGYQSSPLLKTLNEPLYLLAGSIVEYQFLGQVVEKAHVILWFPHAVLERSQSQGLQIESLEQMELVSAELPAHNEKPSLPNGRHLDALFCAGAVTLCAHAFFCHGQLFYTHTSTML